MVDVPAARLIWAAAIFAIGGCGSDRGVSAVPPPDASSPGVPSALETASASPASEADEAPPPIPGLRRDFDPPLRARAVTTGDPELDPLASYLKASFAAELKDGGRLVVIGRTDASGLHVALTFPEVMDLLLRCASDQFPADMVRDFGEKNREPREVRPELTRHLPARLQPHEEAEDFFADGVLEGWRRFDAKYPDSIARLKVSRVGLNLDRTMALFYVEVGYGFSSGHGQIHVLRKDGDVWVEVPVECLPAWTA